MPGPPPKPTHLKLVTGNPGRRPLNKREPRPTTGTPTAPAHLSVAARREWRRISLALAKMGVLTPVDRAALAAYCQAYADWAEAEKDLAINGRIILSPVKTVTKTLKNGTQTVETSGGFPMQNPWLAIRNRALELMHKFLAEFGMTPASRTRIVVEDGGEQDRPKDPAASYF
jgi:P27 family predicted phage terminase small subunit